MAVTVRASVVCGMPEQLGRRLMQARSTAESWWEQHRDRHPVLGWAGSLHERDRDSFASVLGSAVALRLFLFVLPATLVMVSFVHLVNLDSVMTEHLEASVTTGEVARSLHDVSWTAAAGFFVSGLVLTLWAGRSLARVLATSSVASWRLEPRQGRLSIGSIVVLSGVLFATVAASSVFDRLRDDARVSITLASWTAVLAVTTVSWFLVMLTLPRGTSDPGALLPGAALLGVGYTVSAWFMQYYLPNRIERSSDTFGSLATSVATLGWFFAIGRMMSASFVVAAVTYERFGSLSRVVFGLPLLRVLPRKVPRLVSFFDLEAEPGASGGDADAGAGAEGGAHASAGPHAVPAAQLAEVLAGVDLAAEPEPEAEPAAEPEAEPAAEPAAESPVPSVEAPADRG